jgi:uncharacterized protein YcbK (DUF882 family)
MLGLIAGAATLPGMARAVPVAPSAGRRLSLVSPHTGETFDGVYRDDSGPLAGAMADLSVFLRDFHCGETIAINVAMLNFLANVMDAVGATRAIVLSAFRTPETNAMLARTMFGVAEHSQHIYGRAIDFVLPGRLEEAMLAARAMQRGGVGWYPRSGFLHIDAGPVRNWDLHERDLGSLLFNGRHLRPNDKGELLLDTRLENSRLLPGMENSGRLLPGMENSGRLLPGMENSGRPLQTMENNRRLR